MNEAAISCTGLTKYYGGARGVENLDLNVAQGAFYGFIGPNGAGKSTTIRALLGLLAPTAGEVRVLGLDPRRRAERTKLLALVGYLPSETQFYPGMRVGDILAFSADLRGKSCKAEAARLCGRLALDPNKKIEQLSLGNRKKVGIVCAMQHDPALYILDEPTSGLDPLMQQEFFSLLEEKHAEGRTVFFSSHVLEEVQRHCGRAAVLRAGRLAAEGRVEELTGAAARQISLTFADAGAAALPAPLAALAGASGTETAGRTVRFFYSGAPAPLLAALAALPAAALCDVSITQPSLEDVFLQYYREG